MLDIQEVNHATIGPVYGFKKPDGTMGYISKEKYSKPQAADLIAKTWKMNSMDRDVGIGMRMDPLSLGAETGAIGSYLGKNIADMMGGKEFDGSYSNEVDYQQATMDLDAFMSPKKSIASRVIGGVVSGAPAKGAFINPMGAAPSAVSTMAGEVGVGATYGLVEGAGTGDSLYDRAQNAVMGAVIGGTFGAVFPGLTKGAIGLFHSLKRMATNGTKPEVRQQILNKLMKAMEADGITPDRIIARMKQIGPEATVLDAGGANVQGTARATQAQEGPAKQIIKNRLESRQGGQGERVADAISENLDTAGDYGSTIDSIITRRSAEAADNYTPLQTMVSDSTEDFAALAKRPSVKSAYEAAKNLAKEEGVPFPDTLEEALKGGADFKTWEYIKRGIDDVIYGARRNGEWFDPSLKKMTNIGKEQMSKVQQTRHELIDAMDNAFDGYNAARSAYAGETRLIEAGELGRRFARDDLDLTVKRLAEMGESEREVYREGVARALQDIMDNVQDGGNVVRRIFGKKALRKKLRPAFNSDKEYRAFVKTMLAEAEMSAAKASVLGGSQTARIQAETAGLMNDLSSFGIDIATGGVGSAVTATARSLFGRRATLSPEQSRQAAKALTGNVDQARTMLTNTTRNSRLGRAAAVAGGNSAAMGGGILSQEFLGE